MIGIDVRSLSRRLGSEWVLARVTFSLERGKIALLSGPNGSGKTTLLRCLSTLSDFDHGSVSIDGFDLGADRAAARTRMSVVLDETGAYGDLSALENLEIARNIARESGPVNEIEPAVSALQRAGLQESLARTLPLRACSAGMKRRFQFARLFMLNRPVAFLDEPEAHLDAAGLALVKDSLWKLKERGATIVLATHAVDAFADLANARFRLVSGRLTPSA